MLEVLGQFPDTGNRLSRRSWLRGDREGVATGFGAGHASMADLTHRQRWGTIRPRPFPRPTGPPIGRLTLLPTPLTLQAGGSGHVGGPRSVPRHWKPPEPALMAAGRPRRSCDWFRRWPCKHGRLDSSPALRDHQAKALSKTYWPSDWPIDIAAYASYLAGRRKRTCWRSSVSSQTLET